MGQHLGYIGNEPVYDNRIRGLPPDVAIGNELSGEERFQRKLKSLKLEDACPCEILVPHQGEYSRRLSWLLMDGVSGHTPLSVGLRTGAELIAFDLRGNGIHLIYNETHWAKLRVFDPAELRQHHCHADGCESPVPPKMFMCRRHWSMVPKVLQTKIWEHYQEGQELGQATPTQLYLEYTDQARRAVRDLEAERETQRREREAEYQRKQSARQTQTRSFFS